ncbi:fatty acid desaturase-domain-containing protein [Radiomyces spectabilis]|uniref:fatty acid desaturase-domain-containing protein n=1 Tax=Radiomyces spectabilis TaxID=64574 RepID=UPI002221117F|nr:fatty acid desaturase-domain-containing protein [Radiomyces spectabilis]KAI8393705.1 fatty acid desaturase-domain-containing protein [Radiomyces spectabilis]
MAVKRTAAATPGLQTEEAAAKGWEIPNFTIKEIREAIPAHCFKRDTFRSFTYVLHDLTIMFSLGYLATFIDRIPSPVLRWSAWLTYWIVQGICSTGLWVLGHECGHQAFSPSKLINNSVGMVLHSALLVPYHSWRYSHSKHHKATGHMSKDQVFVPSTRSEVGLPPRDQDPEGDGPHSAFEETPIMALWNMTLMMLFGWPLYLLTNVSGQDYPGWASHFNPYCAIFEKNQRWDVVTSTIGILVTMAGLAYCGSVFGSLAVIKYYVIPYLFVNFWLTLITYLQHTDPKLPHYRENLWNFQRGAALTVDRSYGTIIDYLHHHISDTHVAHHFFSTMPHYHAEEATRYIKKALGKHYMYDPTPIAVAFWRSWNECRFVEDEGDVVFYKN